MPAIRGLPDLHARVLPCSPGQFTAISGVTILWATDAITVLRGETRLKSPHRLAVQFNNGGELHANRLPGLPAAGTRAAPRLAMPRA